MKPGTASYPLLQIWDAVGMIVIRRRSAIKNLYVIDGADMDGIGIEKLGKLLETEFEVVDLSPVLERGIPRWPSHPHLVIDKTVTHEHDGFYCQGLSMAEHTGAHVDAPEHSRRDRMERAQSAVI